MINVDKENFTLFDNIYQIDKSMFPHIIYDDFSPMTLKIIKLLPFNYAFRDKS